MTPSSTHPDLVADWTAVMEAIDAEVDPFLTGERTVPLGRAPEAPAAPETGRRGRTTGLTSVTEAVSIRIPHFVIREIRAEAARLGVPYQTMMNMWLEEIVKAPR